MQTLTPQSSKRVYLIGGAGVYKIGSTCVSAQERRMALQIGSPVKLRVVCEIPDNHGNLETALHQRFRSKRLHGEWFSLSLADVEFIKNLPSINWRTALNCPDDSKVTKAIASLNRLRTEVDPKFQPEIGNIADSLESLLDGASKGGNARAKKLSKKRRKEIAQGAAAVE